MEQNTADCSEPSSKKRRKDDSDTLNQTECEIDHINRLPYEVNKGMVQKVPLVADRLIFSAHFRYFVKSFNTSTWKTSSRVRWSANAGMRFCAPNRSRSAWASTLATASGYRSRAITYSTWPVRSTACSTTVAPTRSLPIRQRCSKWYGRQPLPTMSRAHRPDQRRRALPVYSHPSSYCSPASCHWRASISKHRSIGCAAF